MAQAKFIRRNHFSGQGHTTEGSGREGYRLGDLIGAQVDDMADIYAMLRALAAKLDLDAGVTDTDFEAVIDAIPAETAPRITIVTA